MMWGWGSWGGLWPGMGFMMLWIIGVGGIITLVVWLVWKFSGRHGSGLDSGTRHDPIDIAKERYARGEITREQYEQIRNDILK